MESIVLGCALTAVLAGVGLSRELAEGAQVVLIVLAGVAGTLCGLVVWRLQGGRACRWRRSRRRSSRRSR